MSKFYDINEDTLTVEVTPGDIDLENNCRYDLQCMVTMDSGLTEEEKISFKVSFVETEYFPTAEILFNSDTLSTHIRPYCTERHFNFYEVESTAGEASYTGTNIKATNTIEAPFKSAILKGNTLVNLAPKANVSLVTEDISRYSNINSELNYLTATVNSSLQGSWHYVKSPINLSLLKPNTKYLVKFDQIQGINSISFMQGEGTKPLTNNGVINSNHAILTTNSLIEINNQILYLAFPSSTPVGTKIIVSNPMIIEYQDGMENWDIPYFDGMQSVRMPVLTTTGKNLFNPTKSWSSAQLHYTVTNGSIFINGTCTTVNDMYLHNLTDGLLEQLNSFKMGTSITLSNNLGKKNYIGVKRNGVDVWTSGTLTIQSGDSDIRCFTRFEVGETYANQEIKVQLEVNTVATSYEPYKSNILSTPSDLELRGIGDIQDILNLNSGEVVERIGEVIFDGSEDEAWVFAEMKGDNYRFRINLDKPGKGYADTTPMECDSFKVGTIDTEYTQEQIVTYNHDTHFEVRLILSQTTISSNNVDELRLFLKSKPIKINYQLAQEVHKTVDLSIVDQDNSPVNWLSTFKDITHISGSSGTTNSLVGELDVVVKTKDTLVSYNRTEIKIDPLEGTSIDGAITTEGDLVFVGVNSKGQVIYFTVKESTREYLVENVTLSVYRQDYDGRFVTIATDIENLNSIYVTDPHPPLNYVNYRIVVTDKITGSISYVDIPPYEIGVKSVIIQWGETWENLTVLGQDPVEQIEWAGSMLKLPYNIDVSDSNTMDVSLVEYIGRAHPVSYYGTQLGVASTWNVDIPKYDTSTLYGLRLLSVYAGDVYVREPSGSGYWANISVSFSQKHRDLIIPVTLDIKRVDGDI